jgi:hypothetical protein
MTKMIIQGDNIIRKSITIVPGKILIKGNVILFTIQIEDHFKKQILNFDSPRTILATKKCGVALDDCILKEQSEFKTKFVKNDVQELRYQHHVKRVHNSILKVLHARRDISILFTSQQIRENTISGGFQIRAIHDPSQSNRRS